MSKRVAVLFSGGLDSTYLIWKNLKDGNEVLPIYVEIENNLIKSIIEKNRIKLLLKEFQKEFNVDKTKIHDIRYAMNIGIRADEGSLYFKQIPIWIFAAVYIQGMDIDELQIGYVSTDDSISYINDIQNIYQSYQTISEPMKPLLFPLIKVRKYDIAQELPKQYFDLIFSCENARIIGSEDAEIIDYEACCECAPCKTIIATDYYGTCQYPEYYKVNLLNKYIKAIYSESNYKVVDEDGVEYYTLISENIKPIQMPYQLTIDFDGDCGHEPSFKPVLTEKHKDE